MKYGGGTWPECDGCPRQLPNAVQARGNVLTDEAALARIGWTIIRIQGVTKHFCPECESKAAALLAAGGQ